MIDSQTLATLRDRIRTNTEELRKLRQQIELSNLLKAYELGLISRDTVENNKLFYDAYGSAKVRKLSR